MYRLLSIKNRRLIAIPDGKKVIKLAAAKRYQPVTLKKSLLSFGFKALIYSGLDKIATEVTSNPLNYIIGFQIDEFNEYICNLLRVEYAYMVIIWPPQIERNRVYVHILDYNNIPIAFVKIAFDKENVLLINNEKNTIESLKKLNLKFSYQPSVINYGSFDNFSCLVLEPIPEAARKVRLTRNAIGEIINEYTFLRKRITLEDLFDLKWWSAYIKESCAFASFNADMMESISNGIEVSRIHGDFCQHNMVQVGESIWIYDWEHSCALGPVESDRLCLWLETNNRLIQRKPHRAVQLLKDQLIVDYCVAKRNDLITSLGYLIAMKKKEALLLAENW